MADTLDKYLSHIQTLEERLAVVRQYIYLFESPEQNKIEKTPKQPEDSIPTSDYPDELNDNLEEVLTALLPTVDQPTTKPYIPEHLLLLLSTSEACQVPLIQQKWHEKLIPLLDSPSSELIESVSYLLLHGLMCPLLAPRISKKLCSLLTSTPSETMSQMVPSKRLSLLSSVGTLAHRNLLEKNGVDCNQVLESLLNEPIQNDVPSLHATIRCIAGLIKSVNNVETIKKVCHLAIEKLNKECDIRTEVHLHAIIANCAHYEEIAKELLTTNIYFGIIQNYIKNKPSKYGSVDVRYFAIQTLISCLSVVKELHEESVIMCDSVLLALPTQPLLAHLGADNAGGQHPQMLGVLGLKAMALILIRLITSNTQSNLVYQHIKRLSVQNVIATIGRCTIIDIEEDDEPPKVKSEIKNDRDTALYWGLVVLQKMFSYEVIMKKKGIEESMNQCESGLSYLVKAVKAYCDKTPDIASIFVDVIKNVKFDILKAEDNKSHFVHRFVQLMRDYIDSCYEHTAAKALFGLCELHLININEIDTLGNIVIEFMKRMNELTPENVESLYSLIHIISEVDSSNELVHSIVSLANEQVIPWIISHQEILIQDESNLEKYDFLILVLLVLFCKVPKTPSIEKSVKEILNVYGNDAGEITDYCNKLLN
ncbi:hypothetical protein EHI8A_181190 [Entamoeba histolytica HM-1:IMSS-B]|uniref:Uncharacterized protein n=6 Tax=Entamoeba histolytica TaxID=5759 RepID=C4M002_ENTH1|nr:hypothetical protein EHI_065860 [Entamoeba histolytica HM-1:IMSS]EMD43177.1 Hypothetical protein EHI5A_155670 [Entamoeba histolytica KU27]EMH77940.1 hypothetical protein EHI8A_181190 [Entamoeba histolytica HM-1:IMSS-B]EMS14890.1 hypothetical protein KM1_251200 [Entamoeba histolytica HM-3:IMSS]GAT94465.1 hypothetical protein CL6EHI_065860 [Entamoeba histolytica]EAL48277.2 hypothetical protein EHI_065860 [Entamoeba histolytica HM-1:IMSS]|eukprot:XP_653663.2 hypothetical protein EHI_065860 [Entamoeba histolytica HM-1:IMSS]